MSANVKQEGNGQALSLIYNTYIHFYLFTSPFFFLQKLETDEDDSYLNSDWADPQALKRQFHGVGNVKWRPQEEWRRLITSDIELA